MTGDEPFSCSALSSLAPVGTDWKWASHSFSFAWGASQVGEEDGGALWNRQSLGSNRRNTPEQYSHSDVHDEDPVVLFGTPYNEQKYKEVLDACDLGRDVEVLEYGDDTDRWREQYLAIYPDPSTLDRLIMHRDR